MASIGKASIGRSRSDRRPAAASEPAGEELVRLAVEAARDRKAEELKVLDLSAVSDFTDRFLLCSGSNQRQVQAIADAIAERLGEQGRRPLHVEGHAHARWILLDFGGEMVVHVFLGETRRFYDLDRLWADAADVTAHYPG